MLYESMVKLGKPAYIQSLKENDLILVTAHTGQTIKDYVYSIQLHNQIAQQEPIWIRVDIKKL